MGVVVLRGSCPRGSCPQGSCPRGSCPRGSCPVTGRQTWDCHIVRQYGGNSEKVEMHSITI